MKALCHFSRQLTKGLEVTSLLFGAPVYIPRMMSSSLCAVHRPYDTVQLRVCGVGGIALITAIGVSYPSKRERVLGAEFAMMLKAMIPYLSSLRYLPQAREGQASPLLGG